MEIRTITTRVKIYAFEHELDAIDLHLEDEGDGPYFEMYGATGGQVRITLEELEAVVVAARAMEAAAREAGKEGEDE